MIETRTKRLRILHLELSDMELLTNENGKAEFNVKMGLNSSGESTKDERDFINGFCQTALGDMDNVMWYNLKQIVLVTENKIIGGICFKGGPNENGQVEIGYGLDCDNYFNKGYMSEAVEVIVKWAISQNGVSEVIAETDKENVSSQRILEKISMIKYKETDNEFWWKLPKSNFLSESNL